MLRPLEICTNLLLEELVEDHGFLHNFKSVPRASAVGFKMKITIVKLPLKLCLAGLNVQDVDKKWCDYDWKYAEAEVY